MKNNLVFLKLLNILYGQLFFFFLKYMKYLKLAILCSILLSAVIFFDPMTYKSLGSLSWAILCFIMIIRPLSDVFPNFPILKKGVLLRKELGIACASFGIAHAVGFFLMAGVSPIVVITSPEAYWGFSNFLTWGILALLSSIIPLVTSNLYSMKLLKKNWKTLQRLAYLFFIFTALHIAFIHPSVASFLESATVVIVWAILWILAYKKINYVNDKKKVIISLVLIALIFIGQAAYGSMSRPERPMSKSSVSTEVQE